MGFLKKHYFPLLLLSLSLVYFLSRFWNILTIPIFTDEAIYIRWAQIAATDPNWFFISLTDGKQPLFIWLMVPWITFLSEPLLAGRIVSIMAGLFTMFGLYLLTYELFQKRIVALFASFFYLVSPFALVYDRIALYDSLVATLAVWALYAEVTLVKYLRLRDAVIAGVIIGFGLLNKSSAEISLGLLPFALLLFPFHAKDRMPKLRRFIVMSLAVAAIAFAIEAVMRLSVYYYIINQKNAVFVVPFSEWIHNPLAYVSHNVPIMLGWLIQYVSLPFLLLLVVSLFVQKKLWRPKLLLLVWFILPFIALSLFGRVIYPRYILFMVMPFFVLAALGLSALLQHVRVRFVQALIIIVFLLPFLITDYQILTDFKNANIPHPDREQLLTGWPSGVGVKETVSLLREKAKEQKIYVATEGTFGLMPNALEIYLHDNPNITTKGFYSELKAERPPQEVIDAAQKMPTYFIFYQPCGPCAGAGEAPLSWDVKKIFQLQKEDKASFYTIYEVL